MADKDGNKTGGRVAGTPNKKNQEVYELASEFGITPMRVKYLLMCLELKELGYDEEDIKSLSIKEKIDIQDRNATDIATYMYGKRKPVDSEGNDKGDPLSDLIDALRPK